MNKDKLIIFDTTLRDGEQSPGASMTRDEKIRIARALEVMKVDIIEAGFPIASDGDFEAVKAVAEIVKDSTVCALARAKKIDIDRAGEAIKPANSGRIHTFLATSPIHMQHKLRMSPDEVVEAAVKAVRMARAYTDNVEFSPEDAGRSEPDFLCRILEAVIAEGATTINIPDTVGYNIPHQFGELIRRQVECTINGLGERAGNASLEEIVMAIRTRQDEFPCDTELDTTQIMTCSKLVAGITGFNVQPNKAIVGANAFAHESGIHQDGVLKQRETYEIMRAQDVGWATNKLVLGKHSGRNAFKSRMAELNIEFSSEEELNEVFVRFKTLADKKHEIFDEDLQALVSESGLEIENESIKLVALRVCCETGETPNATMTLNINGEEKRAESTGDGPVDACFKAIEKLTATGVNLQLYSVNAITTGTDSQGEVTVRVEKDGQVVNGQGADTDIVIASAKSYINALNKVISNAGRTHPQMGDV